MARAGDVNAAEEWLQKMLQVRAGALADWRTGCPMKT